MRGWPISMTSTTDASPAMAPMLTRGRSQLSAVPAWEMATYTGSGTLSVV